MSQTMSIWATAAAAMGGTHDAPLPDQSPRNASGGLSSIPALLTNETHLLNHERQALLAANLLGDGVTDGTHAISSGLAKRGVASTYVLLEGCPKRLGCTIILRGSNNTHTLKQIKRVLRFVINVTHNLHLETRFLRERCVCLPNNYVLPENNKLVCSSSLCVDYGDGPSFGRGKPIRPWNGKNTNSNSSDPHSSSQNDGSNHKDVGQRSISGKITAFDHQSILITSVWMTDKSQCCPAEVKGICYYTPQDVSLGQFLRDSCFNTALKCQDPACKKTVFDHTLSFIHNDGMINISVENMNDPLPPPAQHSEGTATNQQEDHKHPVSSSSSPPSSKQNNHHGDKDGGGPNGSSSRTDQSNGMHDSTGHSNSHGNGNSKHTSESPIATWTYCTMCEKVVTPLVYISDDTWRYSFGKFLEVYFYNRDALINSSHHSCQCSMQRSVLYFGSGKLATRFTYERVKPFGVFVRRVLSFDTTLDREGVFRHLERISGLSSELFVRFDKHIEKVSREVRQLFGSAANKPEHLQKVLSELNSIGTAVDDASKKLQEEIAAITNRYGRASSSNLLMGGGGGKVVSDKKDHEELFRFPWHFRRELFLRSSAWNERLSASGQALSAMKKLAASQSNIGVRNDIGIGPANLVGVGVDNGYGSTEDVLEAMKRLRQLQEMYSKQYKARDLGITSDNVSVYITQQQSVMYDETSSHSAGRVGGGDDINDDANAGGSSGGGGKNRKKKRRQVNEMDYHDFEDDIPGNDALDNEDDDDDLEYDCTVDIEDQIDDSNHPRDSSDSKQQQMKGLHTPERGQTKNSNYHSDTSPASGRRYYRRKDSFATDDMRHMGQSPGKMHQHRLLMRHNKQQSIHNSYDMMQENSDQSTPTQLPLVTSKTVTPGGAVKSAFNRLFNRGKNEYDPYVVELGELAEGRPRLDPGVGGMIVPVFDEQPSTVIAHSLSSKEYKSQFQEFTTADGGSSSVGADATPGGGNSSNSSNNRRGDNNNNNLPKDDKKDIERRMLVRSKSHIKHSFRDVDVKGQTLCKFVCTTYWATQFHAVRQVFLSTITNSNNSVSGSKASSPPSNNEAINALYNEEKCFIRSLSSSNSWAASGGKSGAAFAKTKDDRFVVKCISRTELQMFLDCAPAYFEYLSKSFFHGLPTVLCKIVGVYQIGYHNKATGKRDMQQVAVMQNIFYGRKITKTFDLKGSLRGRFAKNLESNNVGVAGGNQLDSTEDNNESSSSKDSVAHRKNSRSKDQHEYSDSESDEDDEDSSVSTDDSNEEDNASADRSLSPDSAASSQPKLKPSDNGDGGNKARVKIPSSETTLLDGDFLEFTAGKPLPLSDRAKAVFHMSILNDTLFLTLINVLDYSILVGIDEENMELVIGIIDFMRQYDILKQMERVGKSIPMVVGSEAPTIIQPPLYKARFTNAMEKYFMTVPTKWTTI